MLAQGQKWSGCSFSFCSCFGACGVLVPWNQLLKANTVPSAFPRNVASQDSPGYTGQSGRCLVAQLAVAVPVASMASAVKDQQSQSLYQRSHWRLLSWYPRHRHRTWRRNNPTQGVKFTRAMAPLLKALQGNCSQRGFVELLTFDVFYYVTRESCQSWLSLVGLVFLWDTAKEPLVR